MLSANNLASAVSSKQSQLVSTIDRIEILRERLVEHTDRLATVSRPVLMATPDAPEGMTAVESATCPLHGRLLDVERSFSRAIDDLTSIVDRIQL